MYLERFGFCRQKNPIALTFIYIFLRQYNRITIDVNAGFEEYNSESGLDIDADRICIKL